MFMHSLSSRDHDSSKQNAKTKDNQSIYYSTDYDFKGKIFLSMLVEANYGKFLTDLFEMVHLPLYY